MAHEKVKPQIWVGVAGVVPREGCELLSINEGAYVNFLTLASSGAEYRAKLAGALTYYCLELMDLEDVRVLSSSDGASEEIMLIAEELERGENPKTCSLHDVSHLSPGDVRGEAHQGRNAGI